jgi:hypothetical protein
MLKKIISVLILSAAISGCWKTSEGEKIGTLVKIAKEGVIIGTWECELIRGGMNSGSGSFGNAFHFTIEDNRLLAIAQEAMRQQSEVKIRYHKEFATLARTENDNYFLDDIEVIK